MKYMPTTLFLLLSLDVIEYLSTVFYIFYVRWGSVKMEMQRRNGKT